MTASDSPIPLNWDFTPVHDLLRSPIDGCTARPSRHNESTIPSLGEQQAKGDPRYTTNGRLVDLISNRSNPKLGDFGALWELFNGVPAPAGVTPTLGTTKTTKFELQKVQPSLEELPPTSAERPDKKVSFPGPPGIETSAPVLSNTSRVINEPNPWAPNDTATGYISHSSSRPKAQATGIPADFQGQSFTILRRTSVRVPSGISADVKFGIPRTPPETIAKARVDDSSDTPTAKPKPRSRGKDFHKNTRNNPVTSEESAGLDSDSSIVFDHPLSEKPVAIRFVPTRVGTSEAKNCRYDTPPSSFEDNDWILNADTVKGLASGGARVRSTLHLSAADRRTTLITRLLGHFPAYAQIVSQVGQISQHRPIESIDSHPIHIFVDMSNVRFSPSSTKKLISS
jgi:hypothetical protein